jgi:hypothetical protein
METLIDATKPQWLDPHLLQGQSRQPGHQRRKLAAILQVELAIAALAHYYSFGRRDFSVVSVFSQQAANQSSLSQSRHLL